MCVFQYWFVIKVHESWHGNHNWISTSTSPFSMKQVPIFEEKWTRFVAILTQQTGVCGFRPGTKYFKVNICWLERFMKPAMGIINKFPVQLSSFSTKTFLILEENTLVLWLLWPKTHVCIVVDWYYTSLNLILVQYQGSWSLGRESSMNFYSNLTIFCKASPHFWGKLTSSVAVLAQNTCAYGCRLVLYQFKFNISYYQGLWSLRGESYMDFYSNLTIFSLTSPHLEVTLN